MLNHKDSNDINLNWKLSELANQIRTETNKKQQWQTDKKAPIHSGNISSGVPITDKKVKRIEKPKQLQWNELKSELTLS